MMQFENFMIGLIVISIFSVGFTGLYVGSTVTYGVQADSDTLQVFNRLNSTYSIADSISEDIRGASVQEDQGDLDLSKTMRSALKALKVVFMDGLPDGLGMISNIVVLIPLPSFIITGLQAILIISLMFSLIYLFLRYKNP